MYKAEINTQENEEICCKCNQWSKQRVHIVRLDILNEKIGFITANDLFDNVLCKDCFILHYLNICNELQITTTRKKQASKKKRSNTAGHH